MGSAGFSFLLFVGLILYTVLQLCDAGITSSYVRNNDLDIDMPLDSDVFRVPPGYNAPQQVFSVSVIFCLFFSIKDCSFPASSMFLFLFF